MKAMENQERRSAGEQQGGAVKKGWKIKRLADVLEFWHPDGTQMSAQQFMEILFGKLPDFFKNEEELRTLWSTPSTRSTLLEGLAAAQAEVSRFPPRCRGGARNTQADPRGLRGVPEVSVCVRGVIVMSTDFRRKILSSSYFSLTLARKKT